MSLLMISPGIEIIFLPLVLITGLLLLSIFSIVFTKKIIKDTSNLNNGNHILIIAMGFFISSILSIILMGFFTQFFYSVFGSLGYNYLYNPILTTIFGTVFILFCMFLLSYKLIKEKILSIKYSVLPLMIFVTILVIFSFIWAIFIPLGGSSISIAIPIIITIIAIGYSSFYFIQKEIKNIKKSNLLSKLTFIFGIITIISLLGLLFVVITPRPVVPNNAETILGNSLSAIKIGGQLTTQSFSLYKGQVISSTLFENKGFDPKSLIFALDNSSLDSRLIVSFGDNGSKLANTTNAQINLKAVITCSTNGKSIIKDLNIIDPEYISIIEKTCGLEDIEPCCEIKIKRA